MYAYLLLIPLTLAYGRPNVLILIADDLGIGDLGCFGNDSVKTPHIDSLATNGVKLTHHLAAASLCSPSRAALLVGKYPARFGFVGGREGPPVPTQIANKVHLPYEEVTIAEIFKAANYTTGIVGKWHLGSDCSLFGKQCIGPMKHGFSYFYGLLASLLNEMGFDVNFFILNLDNWRFQAIIGVLVSSLITTYYLFKRKLRLISAIFFILTFTIVFILWFCCAHLNMFTKHWYKGSPWFVQNMMEVISINSKPIERQIEFDGISQKLVEKSADFIDKSAQPFFLIHSFLHTHSPMFTSHENKGRSACGRYCDNVEEMDDGVGILLHTLEKNGILDNTIVYFVSDHGAHLELVTEEGEVIGGYNGKFKGGKSQGGQEGGIRVPGLIQWKGKISPGNLTEPTSLMDLMPTLAELSGISNTLHSLTNLSDLDGRSFSRSLLKGKNKEDNERIFLHFCRDIIHAVRWKTDDKIYKMHLHWPKWTEGTQCGRGDVYCSCYDSIDLTENPRLYNLASDPYEDYPINDHTEEYKFVVSHLKKYLVEWRKNVTCAPSIMQDWYNSVWRPWLQPFLFL